MCYACVMRAISCWLPQPLFKVKPDSMHSLVTVRVLSALSHCFVWRGVVSHAGVESRRLIHTRNSVMLNAWSTKKQMHILGRVNQTSVCV